MRTSETICTNGVCTSKKSEPTYYVEFNHYNVKIKKGTTDIKLQYPCAAIKYEELQKLKDTGHTPSFIANQCGFEPWDKLSSEGYARYYISQISQLDE